MADAPCIPALLYHGTFASRIPGIMERGLGAGAVRNYEISRPGVVCLSDDPDAADIYAAESQFHSGEVVVLQIDTTFLDRSLIRPDRNDEGKFGGTSWEYSGIVPADAISLLGLAVKAAPRWS